MRTKVHNCHLWYTSCSVRSDLILLEDRKGGLVGKAVRTNKGFAVAWFRGPDWLSRRNGERYASSFEELESDRLLENYNNIVTMGRSCPY